MFRRTFLLFVVCCFVVNLLGQDGTSKPAATPDASWVRDFASPSQGSQKGRENQLNWDPRFRTLLRSLLPQHQFFWRDHGHFTSLPELVLTFIGGGPGDVLLDQNRYVTINGCVPHACSARGMVWIDTAPSKEPSLIFVATSNISGSEPERLIHLWVYSSTPLNWQKLPPQFLSSLTQWWNNTTRVWADISPERIVLVTIVQPSGEMVDLSPSVFALSSGAKE